MPGAAPHVNLLHRYLFRELLAATATGVALFAFVLLAGNAIKDVAGLVADGKLDLGTTARILGMLFPFVLSYALPMGLLTAVLLTLGRLSAQHEITALRAAGVGLGRIGASVLAIAVVGVAASLVINFSYGPTMKAMSRKLLDDVVRTNPMSFIVERSFIRQFPGKVLYVGARDGNELRDFRVWELDEANRVTSFIRAERGYFDYNEEDNYILLVLLNGQSELRDTEDPEDFSRFRASVAFDRASLQLPLDRVFRRKVFTKKVSWMNFSELVAEHARLRDATSEEDRRRFLDVKMNIHEKAALAFSVLSFGIIGVPLGIRTKRSETSANLGMALLLVIGYYALMIVASWLEGRPEWRPELLLWLPNVVFQLAGGVMWWRFGRN